MRIFNIWLTFTVRVAQQQFLTVGSGYLFLFGKVFRLLLLFAFLYSILSATKSMAGYSKEQVIFFFLVFNISDLLIQFLFRGVYVFRQLVIDGRYDLDLLKPLPSFFRPLFGWTDVLDFMILIPLWTFSLYYVASRGLINNFFDLFLFFVFLANSVLVGFAIHLFISGICIMTTEIDHLIWIYRDFTHMARFPTDIYQTGIQHMLTFVIPVVVLVTVPAKALMGLLTPQLALISFGISGLFVFISLRFWKYALSKYTSASS